MQNPDQEITKVIYLLAGPKSPDVQISAFRKFVTSDVGFRHPLCSVTPAINSRASLLGIYQWYRVLSPRIDIKVENVLYDPDKQILLLDVVQVFHISFSPLAPASSRRLIRITLREGDGLHYIAFQEDFYHPDDLMALVVPTLSPLVRLFLTGVGIASNIGARFAQTVGIWDIGTGIGLEDDHVDNETVHIT